MKIFSYIVSIAILIFIVGCGGSSGSSEKALPSNSVNIQGLDSNGDVDFEATISLNSAGVAEKVASFGDDDKIIIEYTLDTDNTLLNSTFTLIDTNTSATEVLTDYHQFSYDGEGNLLFAERNDDNYSTNYTYDINNLLIRKESQTDATHSEIEYYNYDADDKLIFSELDWNVDGSIDSNSTFVYDGEGQLIEELMSSGYKATYTYNVDGKVIKFEEDWDTPGYIEDIITIQYESNKIILTYVTDNDQLIYTYNNRYGEIYANNLVQEAVYGDSFVNLKFNEELEKLDYNLDR